MCLIINLFAGPGAGKTTFAHGLVYELKKRGLDAEFVQETAKELIWAEKKEILRNQEYIVAEQYNRIKQVSCGYADIIVVDSPVLLGQAYQNKPIGNVFKEFTLWAHHYFKNNLNYYLSRQSIPYNEKGRHLDHKAALSMDLKILNILCENNISFEMLDSHKSEAQLVAIEIEKRIKNDSLHI